MMKKITIAATVLIVALSGGLFLFLSAEKTPRPIGGEREDHGCLGPAGYSYNDIAGACVREFDMTPDILRAAGIASTHTGRRPGLTVVRFNSYEEPGAYDITFQDGTAAGEWTVYIRNGIVVENL